MQKSLTGNGPDVQKSVGSAQRHARVHRFDFGKKRVAFAAADGGANAEGGVVRMVTDSW